MQERLSLDVAAWRSLLNLDSTGWHMCGIVLSTLHQITFGFSHSAIHNVLNSQEQLQLFDELFGFS